MDTFVPLRFDRDAEDEFLVKPVIVEVARMATDAAKAFFSDRFYQSPKTPLRVTWAASEKFKAGAYIGADGGHEIRLSYGCALEIYRDAFLLPMVCQRTLTNEAFDPIFNLLSYGNARKDVLPAGLEPEDAKVTIIRLMTFWLFLHEQAHLLQRHGEVAKAVGVSELLSHDGGLDDSRDGTAGAPGPAATLRHAFEFAADYEAITSLMMAEAKGMTEAHLWCLAAGLMCMFHRFALISTPKVEDMPSGTHPHPALRMRVAMNRIEQMFALPDYIAASGWRGGTARARAVIDHAVYTADVYWHIRYLGLDHRSPFLDLVLSTLNVPSSYQQAVYDSWSSVQTEIVAGHLGFGDGVTLFFRSPEAVGERIEPFVARA
jgi:hypothetical protein